MSNPTLIQHAVSAGLKPYISSIREYHFTDPYTLKLNPEGCVELVFQRNGSFEQKTHDGIWSKRPQTFIGGLHSKSFEVKGIRPDSKLISVIFHPLGARQFLKEGLADFKNKVVDVKDIEVLKNCDLFERDELNAHEISQTLENNFRGHYANIVDMALVKMVLSKGNVNINEICLEFNIGRSYLHKLFSEQVGMSPKEYCRILRMNHCFKLMQQSDFNTLTELGYLLGYYDQSHFIRDFKLVTGLTPAAYLKEQK